MDYTLISVCIFSILFFIYFLRCQEGEFVKKIKLFLVGDDFLNDFFGLFRGDIVWRNKMLFTGMGQSVKNYFQLIITTLNFS